MTNPTPEKFRAWIEGENIKVLNVAGNRERTNPGTQDFVVTFLTNVLKPKET